VAVLSRKWQKFRRRELEYKKSCCQNIYCKILARLSSGQAEGFGNGTLLTLSHITMVRNSVRSRSLQRSKSYTFVSKKIVYIDLITVFGSHLEGYATRIRNYCGFYENATVTNNILNIVLNS